MELPFWWSERAWYERAERALPRVAGCDGRALDGRSVLDRDAHLAGGAGDDALGSVEVVGVEVGHLGLGDLADLRPGDRRHLDALRGGGALLHTGGLEDQTGGGRGLGHEREGAVLIDRDLDRHDLATLRLGRRVVGLAELHDVDAVLAERGADRRRRRGCTGVDLQLDDRCELLLGGHESFCFLGFRACWRLRDSVRERQIFCTWLNDSSTGVSRPKIETSTFSFCESAWISLIDAGRVTNGPSMTVTDSPISKSAALVSTTFSFFSCSGARNFMTSSSESGDGRCVCPTKPVTP